MNKSKREREKENKRKEKGELKKQKNKKEKRGKIKRKEKKPILFFLTLDNHVVHTCRPIPSFNCQPASSCHGRTLFLARSFIFSSKCIPPHNKYAHTSLGHKASFAKLCQFSSSSSSYSCIQS
jgi:hypothetical protein